MTRTKSNYVQLLQYISIDQGSALPLAVQLQQQLTWLIASRGLKTGDRLPGVRDFARQLGINLHTVRAAYHQLEKTGLVSTRPGIGTLVLEYDPARLAEFSPATPSFLIGVFIPALDNNLYVPFLRGIEDAFEEQPMMLLVCNTRDSTGLAERYFHQLIARQVDGMILASTGLVLPPEVEKAFPWIVYVDDPSAKKNSLQINARQAGFQATRHLIEHGCRKIGLVTAPLEWPNVREPYLGYQDAILQAGIQFAPDLVAETPGFSIEYGERAGKKLLDAYPQLDGIFGSGDLLAIGAMQAVKAAGKRVPADVAVVGFNNIELSELVDPPLTTVSIPMYEIGKEALKMLLRLRQGAKTRPAPLVFDTELVIRNSCGCGRA